MFIKVQNDAQIHTLAGLASEIWNEHYPAIIGQAQVDYMIKAFQSYEAVKAQLREGYTYFLLEKDGQNCGYMGYALEEDALFLSKLYLRKAFRGQGLSRAAFLKLFEIGRENGRNKIRLTCNKQNLNSLAVYQKLGFRVIDSVKSDIGNGFFMDDYVMELTV